MNNDLFQVKKNHVWRVDYKEVIFGKLRKQTLFFASKKYAQAFIQEGRYLSYKEPQKAEMSLKKGDIFKDLITGTNYELNGVIVANRWGNMMADTTTKASICIDFLLMLDGYKKLN